MSDVKQLRAQAQTTTVVMIAVFAWLAFLNACVGKRVEPGTTWIAVFLLIGAALGRPSARGTSRLSTVALMFSICFSYVALIVSYPSGPARYVGILITIVCSTMLSDLAYLLVTAGLCLILVAIEALLPVTAVGWAEITRTAIFLIAGALGLSLSRRHLRMALAWSREGAQSTRELNVVLRDRQLRLNRVLHSMEEATWRIERLNNELVLAQHKAESSLVAKERFASTVSHEIRGPLNLILGFSELMALSPERYGDRLSQAFYKDVDTVYRNTQHLSSLVDDVLDLSRIEAQHLPIIKSEVDLKRDIIEPVLESIRPLADNKGLFLVSDISDTLPPLLVDPVRLRQVALNLLVNSLRLTELGGITIKVTEGDGSLTVGVEDTGPGISEDDIPKIFREFQQLYVNGGHEAGGSGLGLSISKHLVEAHGGRIWAESDLGQGTTINFTLPLPNAPQQVQPIHRTASIQYRVTERSDIVIVHPDPAVIASVQRCLENPHIVGVPDADEVSHVVAKLHPRAVITSHELADRVISELDRLSFDTPIVICGLPDTSTRDDLRGTSGYIIKPVRIETLRPFVTRLTSAESATVLLVDDDPDQVRLMETMIANMTGACKILKAYSGTRAMEILDTVPVDMAFLDWLMPDMDGSEIVARLRDEPRFGDLHIVIVSAKDPGEGPFELWTPLSVQSRRPLPFDVGSKCLQLLVDAIRPSYLKELEPLEQMPVATGD